MAFLSADGIYRIIFPFRLYRFSAVSGVIIYILLRETRIRTENRRVERSSEVIGYRFSYPSIYRESVKHMKTEQNDAIGNLIADSVQLFQSCQSVFRCADGKGFKIEVTAGDGARRLQNIRRPVATAQGC